MYSSGSEGTRRGVKYKGWMSSAILQNESAACSVSSSFSNQAHNRLGLLSSQDSHSTLDKLLSGR